jgi:hypothetical protein
MHLVNLCLWQMSPTFVKNVQMMSFYYSSSKKVDDTLVHDNGNDGDVDLPLIYCYCCLYLHLEWTI